MGYPRQGMGNGLQARRLLGLRVDHAPGVIHTICMVPAFKAEVGPGYAEAWASGSWRP